MSKTVTYYLAPQSPFAYLGHARLVDVARAAGAHIDIKPIDLGRVFAASGGLPLAKRAPQRQAYRLAELQRWSSFMNVPMKTQPSFFPVPGDAAARLIIAARTSLGGEAAVNLAGAIMHALWADDKNIGDEAVLAQVASACGFDGAMLMKSSQTAGVQAEYEKNTDEALAANVFGSPWYIVDGEGFWGQDRLDFVERALT
ncbi:MAG: 2-hydroxychromene-2-carboxylate isomerase [Massilia sp.]